jgi:hypothetical protein
MTSRGTPKLLWRLRSWWSEVECLAQHIDFDSRVRGSGVEVSNSRTAGKFSHVKRLLRMLNFVIPTGLN